MPTRSPGSAAPLLSAVLLSLSALCAAPAGAQAPVTLTFRALGPGGQPVTDLRPDEVSLKVDGRRYPLTSLSFVRLSSSTDAGMAPSFATNETADAGRTVIFVLDDEGLLAGKEYKARQAMARVVGRLSTTDRVGMLSLRTGGLMIQPTSDREAIDAAIARYAGQAMNAETPADLECRTTQIVETLRGLLANERSGRTVFVMISSGTAPIPAEQIRQRLGVSSGLCQLRPQHFSDLGIAAAGSPAAMYVLHDVDSRVEGTFDPASGLESIAGVTGSPIIRLTGNSVAVVDRIAEETSGIYVATFEPAARERDGLSHRAEIAVAREGLKVDGASDVVIPRTGAKGPSPADMLKSTTGYADLPLRATAYAVRDTPSSQFVKVIALFESPDPSVTLGSAALGFVSGTRMVARWTAESQELRRRPAMAAVTVPPGKYRMRVAAVDASGRRGSVDYDLDATLPATGPLRSSAMALGLAQESFVPRLLFGPGDKTAVGYLEIYGVPKGATVTGTVELASAAGGPAIATTPATVQVAAADDMRIAYGGFSIAALQPGDYVLRLVIAVDGKTALTASRALRKTGS